jgi:hypothetical protein
MKYNPYQQKHPYSKIRGAFYSVLSQMPEDVRTSVTHSGQTFAISGTFKYLDFSTFICSTYKDHVYSSLINNKTVKKDVTLYIASEFVLNVCGLSSSEAIAAGLHEGGHALCDMAGSDYPSRQEFDQHILPYITNGPSVYLNAELGKWVNVLADGRLENGIAMQFPDTKRYFYAIQRWVHRLEAEGRGENASSDFMMALRDAVKGWDEDSAREVWEEYLPEARDLVEKLKPIWSKVLPKNTNWSKTAHLPLQAALEIVNVIKDEFENEKQDQQGQGSEDQESKSQGQDSESQGQGSDDQDSDAQGSESQGSGDQDSDDQGSGDQGSDDQGSDDQGQEGQGSDDQGQEGQGQEGQGSDDQGQEGQDSSKKGTLEMLEDLLNGHGKALDPNSAIEENIRQVEEKLGHKIYVPNNKPMTEEKKRLK